MIRPDLKKVVNNRRWQELRRSLSFKDDSSIFRSVQQLWDYWFEDTGYERTLRVWNLMCACRGIKHPRIEGLRARMRHHMREELKR